MSLAQLKIIPFKGHPMERETERDIETLKEFHRVLRRSLRPPVYSVFCAIEDHAGTTPPPGLPPFTCFASESTLAKEASVSRETVIRAIKELAGLNLLTIEDREGYTKLLWPLVTNQGYQQFMLEQEERDLLNSDTCNTEPQGVCQKATGGVSESHTNETKLKKPNNETKKSIAASDEAASPADNQVVNTIVEIDPKPSSRQVEVQLPGPALPPVRKIWAREAAGATSEAKDDQASDKAQIHIPAVPKPVPKPEPKRETRPKKEPDAVLTDPRLLMWRKYADLAEYGPWPNELQRQKIIDTVPIEKLTRWEKVLEYWVGHGWLVKNVDGLLEVFVKGVKKRGN